MEKDNKSSAVEDGKLNAQKAKDGLKDKSEPSVSLGKERSGSNENRASELASETAEPETLSAEQSEQPTAMNNGAADGAGFCGGKDGGQCVNGTCAQPKADVFGEYPEIKVSGGAAQTAKKKPAKLKPSKKIAYSAVAAAIAVVASVVTIFLPVKVMPLVLASFCFYLAFVKCGIMYGLLTAAATVLITFLSGGLSTSLIFLCVTFVPYSLLCLPIRRFNYRSWRGAIIRAVVSIAFINLSFAAVYFIAKYAVLDGFDVLAAMGKAGYFVAALLVSAVAIVTDFLFVQCDALIMPKIK